MGEYAEQYRWSDSWFTLSDLVKDDASKYWVWQKKETNEYWYQWHGQWNIDLSKITVYTENGKRLWSDVMYGKKYDKIGVHVFPENNYIWIRLDVLWCQLDINDCGLMFLALI